MSRLFDELVEKRGLDEGFLRPKYEDLADPFLLPDMEKAVKRLEKAVKNGEKVLIYGDYDVDGVTASTAMYDTLRLMGLPRAEVMLPDRFKDGYGMSERVVDRVAEEGITLVVTVDCGSRNHEIIARLKEMGVDTVVTDHHECGEDLPSAVAVVNPKRSDFIGVEKEQSAEVCSENAGAKPEDLRRGLRDLAGVGVVFEVARAAMARGLIPEGQEKWLLELVLIGTICDSMKITRENRIMTYWGLKVLAKTRRPGMKELLRLAKVKKINAEAIGYRIGPRLNAAGRIASAETALRLLMTASPAEAARLAAELDGLNARRRDMQIQALHEIRAQGVPQEPVIVVTGAWPEGVLGIIAGRLVEEYKRPAFVFARVGEIWKGSGRSFGEFNLAETLGACADCILGGGGHAEACGLKLAAEGLDAFRARVNEYYKGLGLSNQERFLAVGEDIRTNNLRDFSLELVEEMAALEPFGVGNKEPLFFLENVEVAEARTIGAEKNHLSLLLRGADEGTLRLVAWGVPEKWKGMEAGERVSVLTRAIENEFRGTKSVEGEAVEIIRGL